MVKKAARKKLATLPASPLAVDERTVYRFAVHFNKAHQAWGPLDTMLVHFRGQIHPAPRGLVCHAPSESYERPDQPKIVMRGWASGIATDPSGRLHILS